MSRCDHAPVLNEKLGPNQLPTCRRCGCSIRWVPLTSNREWGRWVATDVSFFKENQRRQRRKDIRDILWACVIALVLAYVSVLKQGAS